MLCEPAIVNMGGASSTINKPAVAEPAGAVTAVAASADFVPSHHGPHVPQRGSGSEEAVPSNTEHANDMSGDGTFDPHDREEVDEPFEDETPDISGVWEKCQRDDPGLPPNFGIVCANWGGDRRENGKQEKHMINDTHENPGHVMCLLEAGPRLCKRLLQPWDPPPDSLVRQTADNKRNKNMK